MEYVDEDLDFVIKDTIKLCVNDTPYDLIDSLHYIISRGNICPHKCGISESEIDDIIRYYGYDRQTNSKIVYLLIV